ncbi:MAG: hypothetical protein E6Z06_03620 [Clostridiales bacterium]|nr:hypothetical protein [Clostridiales bacterium]
MLKDVPALSFSAVASCVAGAIALAVWPMAILAILLGGIGLVEVQARGLRGKGWALLGIGIGAFVLISRYFLIEGL